LTYFSSLLIYFNVHQKADHIRLPPLLTSAQISASGAELRLHGKTAYTEGAKKGEIFERPFHSAIGVVHGTRSLSFFCARDRNYFLEKTEPRRKSLV
jgi:hypothetical protein